MRSLRAARQWIASLAARQQLSARGLALSLLACAGVFIAALALGSTLTPARSPREAEPGLSVIAAGGPVPASLGGAAPLTAGEPSATPRARHTHRASANEAHTQRGSEAASPTGAEAPASTPAPTTAPTTTSPGKPGAPARPAPHSSSEGESSFDSSE